MILAENFCLGLPDARGIDATVYITNIYYNIYYLMYVLVSSRRLYFSSIIYEVFFQTFKIQAWNV